MQEETRTIIVYNPSEQKLIAIFKGYSTLAKLWFTKSSRQRICPKIRYAVQNKTQMTTDVLTHSIAIRFAKEEHIKILGDKDYVLF